jgi:uncharacterized RDD family membrane protein YckC
VAGSPPPPPPLVAQPTPGSPPPPPPAPPPPASPPKPASAGPASAATDDDLAALLSRITDDEVSSAPVVGAPLTMPTDVERPERAQVAQIESEGGIDFDPDLASFGARLGGLLIDTAVVSLCLLPGLALLLAGSTPLAVLGLVVMFVGFGATVVLYARAVSTTGQWIGNRVTGTKVVDVRNGRMVTGGEAGLRFVVRQLVSPILLIGFLVALGNSQRRTFHDNIAGTVVTRPPRATWSIDDEVPGV